MSKTSHNQVLEALVRRLSKKYEITAQKVIYGPFGHNIGEVDFMAFRHTPQGIMLNLYEIKTNPAHYEHAVEQLYRAKDYFSSVNTLPDYFKGVVLQWLGRISKDMHINLIYVNPLDGVWRVAKFKYSGLGYVAERGRRGIPENNFSNENMGGVEKVMKNGS